MALPSSLLTLILSSQEERKLPLAFPLKRRGDYASPLFSRGVETAPRLSSQEKRKLRKEALVTGHYESAKSASSAVKD
jgi:hypothetical protein